MERLYRSQKNRVIAGVAGGLAEYFGVDVVLVRLLWVLSIFLGGGGLIVYIVAWIIIPEEGRVFGSQRKNMEQQTGRTGEGAAEEMAFAGVEEGRDKGAVQGESGGESGYREKERWGEGPAARRRRNAGALLIGLGIILLAYQLFGPLLRYTWPILLVVLGVYLLARERREVGL